MSKSILIFENLNTTKKDDYLKSAIPIEITHLLSTNKKLKIISAHSKALLKSKFGKNITVDFNLEGSFLKTNNELRLNFQLIEQKTATCLLSIKLEEHTNNVFQLIDTIALKIVHYLELELNANSSKSKINANAYEHYLKGIHYWSLWNESDIKEAIKHLKKAIELEPRSSLIYLKLSECYSFLAAIVTQNNAENYAAAKAAVLTAVSLDNKSIEAHLSLALIKLVNDVDILGAYYSFESAFAIDNSYAKAHQYYAYYLITIGKYQKAIEALEFVLKLDPLQLQVNSTYGFVLSLHKKYGLAEQHLKKTLSIFPDSEVTYDALIWNYILSKQYHKAQALVSQSTMPLALSSAIEIIIYNTLDERDKIHVHKAPLKTVLKNDTSGMYSKELSAIYFALGDLKKGAQHFETFYQNKMGFIRALSHPAWKSFRDSEKFYIYKKRLKLLKAPTLPKELTVSIDDAIVIHSSTSQIITVASKHLLFIESQGVYCKVVFFNDTQEIQEKLIRTSLTQVIDTSFYPHLFRCHNSFIINTKIPYSISGNRKNLKLNLKDYNLEIPVSRKKTLAIFEMFSTHE